MNVSETEPKDKPSIFFFFPWTTEMSRFAASCGHYDQHGFLGHTDVDNRILCPGTAVSLLYDRSRLLSLSSILWDSPSRLIAQLFMSSLEPPLHCRIGADAGCNTPSTNSSQLPPLAALSEHFTCWLVGFLEDLTLLAKAMRVLGWDVSRIEMVVDKVSCWISREESSLAVRTLCHLNPCGVKYHVYQLILWCHNTPQRRLSSKFNETMWHWLPCEMKMRMTLSTLSAAFHWALQVTVLVYCKSLTYRTQCIPNHTILKHNFVIMHKTIADNSVSINDGNEYKILNLTLCCIVFQTILWFAAQRQGNRKS